jgi:hypothetical protein
MRSVGVCGGGWDVASRATVPADPGRATRSCCGETRVHAALADFGCASWGAGRELAKAR